MLIRQGAFYVGTGYDVRQLGGVGNHFIVGLRGGKLHPAEADIQEEIPRLLQQCRICIGIGGENHGSMVEQIIPCVLEAGKLPSCHGMTADEMPGRILHQRLDGLANDLLNTAAVNDQTARLEKVRVGSDPVNNRPGIQRNQNEIAAGDDRIIRHTVNGPQQGCLIHGGGVQIHTVNPVLRVQLDGASQGAANQTQTDNRNIHPTVLLLQRGTDSLMHSAPFNSTYCFSHSSQKRSTSCLMTSRLERQKSTLRTSMPTLAATLATVSEPQ